VVAEWIPSPPYEAFPGVLNGGIIGALLDCHSNWTAAWALMRQSGSEAPPCTVTAQYSIKLMQPTPTDGPIQLVAKVSALKEDRAVIEAELWVKNKVCATCTGTFVSVKPGHPAYHRW
jgi:acyl-coenzyme A thioesterase PaaI-like protein